MIIPTTSKASYSKGHWLIHNDGNNIIQIWRSSFTGKERIYINNELVSELNSANLPSVHKLMGKDCMHYEIHFNPPTFSKSSLECTIEREGALIKMFKVKREPRKSFVSKGFLAIIAASAILGGIKSFYGFSDLFFIALLVIVLIAGFVFDPVKAMIEE